MGWIAGQLGQALAEDQVAIGRDVIDAIHRGEDRHDGEDFGMLDNHALDRLDRIAEAIELGFGVAFGGFDHQPEGFGPGDRRCVESKVEEELAHAGYRERAGNPGGFESGKVVFTEGEDELVHARPDFLTCRQRRVVFAQAFMAIAGGERGQRRHAGNPFLAESQKVTVGPNLVREVTPVPVEAADRLGRLDGTVAVGRLLDLMTGKVRHEALADRDNGVARAAPTVRDGPGLMQVVVDGIDADRTEIHPAGDGVHVGTVHVNEPAEFMDLFRDIVEAVFEEPAGIGIGDHDPGDAVAVGFAFGEEVIEVDLTVFPCFEEHNAARESAACWTLRRVSSHHGGREIGSMRAARNEDDVALALSMVAGGRLGIA